MPMPMLGRIRKVWAQAWVVLLGCRRDPHLHCSSPTLISIIDWCIISLNKLAVQRWFRHFQISAAVFITNTDFYS
jgi:hypothetical protein